MASKDSDVFPGSGEGSESNRATGGSRLGFFSSVDATARSFEPNVLSESETLWVQQWLTAIKEDKDSDTLSELQKGANIPSFGRDPCIAVAYWNLCLRQVDEDLSLARALMLKSLSKMYGNKTANLLFLQRVFEEKHLPVSVPSFCPISHRAILEWLNSKGVLLEEKQNPSKLSQSIHSAFLQNAEEAIALLGLEGLMKDAIEKQTKLLIRSTGGLEDSTETSGAGTNTTVTAVNPEPRAIASAMAEVLCSYISTRSVGYIANGSDEELFLPVLPQLLGRGRTDEDIPSSGVVFTTEPQGPTPEVTLIQATFGYQGVVGNNVPCDTFYLFDKRGHASIIRPKNCRLAPPTSVIEEVDGVDSEADDEDTSTSSKSVKTNQSHMVLVMNAPELQDRPSLSLYQRKMLRGVALELERAYERPMDLEFIAFPGTIHIVQARPIVSRQNAMVLPPSNVDIQTAKAHGFQSTRMACLVAGDSRVVVVSHPDTELLVHNDLDAAWNEADRREKDGQKPLGVVILSPAEKPEALSHAAVMFRERGIPVFVGTHLPKLGPEQALLLDPQRKTLWVGPATASSSVIKEGRIRHPVGPLLTHESILMHSDAKTIRDALGDELESIVHSLERLPDKEGNEVELILDRIACSTPEDVKKGYALLSYALGVRYKKLQEASADAEVLDNFQVIRRRIERFGALAIDTLTKPEAASWIPLIASWVAALLIQDGRDSMGDSIKQVLKIAKMPFPLSREESEALSTSYGSQAHRLRTMAIALAALQPQWIDPDLHNDWPQIVRLILQAGPKVANKVLLSVKRLQDHHLLSLWMNGPWASDLSNHDEEGMEVWLASMDHLLNDLNRWGAKLQPVQLAIRSWKNRLHEWDDPLKFHVLWAAFQKDIFEPTDVLIEQMTGHRGKFLRLLRQITSIMREEDLSSGIYTLQEAASEFLSDFDHSGQQDDKKMAALQEILRSLPRKCDRKLKLICDELATFIPTMSAMDDPVLQAMAQRQLLALVELIDATIKTVKGRWVETTYQESRYQVKIIQQEGTIPRVTKMAQAFSQLSLKAMASVEASSQYYERYRNEVRSAEARILRGEKWNDRSRLAPGPNFVVNSACFLAHAAPERQIGRELRSSRMNQVCGYRATHIDDVITLAHQNLRGACHHQNRWIKTLFLSLPTKTHLFIRDVIAAQPSSHCSQIECVDGQLVVNVQIPLNYHAMEVCLKQPHGSPEPVFAITFSCYGGNDDGRWNRIADAFQQYYQDDCRCVLSQDAFKAHLLIKNPSTEELTRLGMQIKWAALVAEAQKPAMNHLWEPLPVSVASSLSENEARFLEKLQRLIIRNDQPIILLRRLEKLMSSYGDIDTVVLQEQMTACLDRLNHLLAKSLCQATVLCNETELASIWSVLNQSTSLLHACPSLKSLVAREWIRQVVVDPNFKERPKDELYRLISCHIEPSEAEESWIQALAQLDAFSGDQIDEMLHVFLQENHPQWVVHFVLFHRDKLSRKCKALQIDEEEWRRWISEKDNIQKLALHYKAQSNMLGAVHLELLNQHFPVDAYSAVWDTLLNQCPILLASMPLEAAVAYVAHRTPLEPFLDPLRESAIKWVNHLSAAHTHQTWSKLFRGDYYPWEIVLLTLNKILPMPQHETFWQGLLEGLRPNLQTSFRETIERGYLDSGSSGLMR